MNVEPLNSTLCSVYESNVAITYAYETYLKNGDQESLIKLLHDLKDPLMELDEIRSELKIPYFPLSKNIATATDNGFSIKKGKMSGDISIAKSHHKNLLELDYEKECDALVFTTLEQAAFVASYLKHHEQVKKKAAAVFNPFATGWTL